ncbi:hypothetical protein ACFLZZ_01750 [Nanoarchaeota archaeon]
MKKLRKLGGHLTSTEYYIAETREVVKVRKLGSPIKLDLKIGGKKDRFVVM